MNPRVPEPVMGKEDKGNTAESVSATKAKTKSKSKKSHGGKAKASPEKETSDAPKVEAKVKLAKDKATSPSETKKPKSKDSSKKVSKVEEPSVQVPPASSSSPSNAKPAKKKGSISKTKSAKKTGSISNAPPTGECSAPPEQDPQPEQAAKEEGLNEPTESFTDAFAEMGIPLPDQAEEPDTLSQAQFLVKKVQVMLHAQLGSVEKGVISDYVTDLGNLVTKIALEKATLVCERDRLLQEVIELKAKPSSYAEAVKVKATEAAPSQRTEGPKRPKRPTKEHVLLIYPKGKKKGGDSIVKRLNDLDPTKLDIHPLGTKKIAGGLLVRLDSETGVDRLESAIKEKEDLTDVWEVRRPKLRKPRVIIYDIPLDLPREELLRQVCTQRGILESQVRVLFSIPREHVAHWVLETDPSVFPQLKGSKLLIGWTRVKVSEHLRPTQCFKCGRFGHISTNCPSKEYCLHCSTRTHSTSECREKKLKCANCAFNNEKFGIGVNQNHSMIDPRCPYRVWEEKQLQKRIDYGY